MELNTLNRLGRKIFGSKNDREIKRLRPLVKVIGDFEPTLEAESDDQLRARIASWKEKISAIEDPEEQTGALDDALPEVFAIVREASKQLTDIYCALTEWIEEHGGIPAGPWVESFDEAEEPQS